MADYQRTLAQYEFIDLIVAFEGLITNQHLRKQFNVSSVQASRILASYRQAFPENLEIITGDGRGRYGPGTNFKPGSAILSVDRYFKITSKTSVHVAVEDTRHDFTKVEPELFRLIYLAINNKDALEIKYRSMKNPEGLERTIHPLAFVFAGRRWHVRAFDEATLEHRDFNLGRIAEIQSIAKNISTPVDSDWNQQVELQLRPHPDLTPAQEQLIRDELFEGAAGRNVRTRKALVIYVLRELEVAENPLKQRPPEYQIHLYKIGKVRSSHADN